jgi:signal transduction histidine kinase
VPTVQIRGDAAIDVRAVRILILEDNPLDAELTAEALPGLGAAVECLHVSDETSFRAALGDGGVDLILSDYLLPGFDGLAALMLAREVCPDVPFIFVSGELGEERAVETLRSGATDFVLKHRLERLVPVAQRALKEADLRSERKRAEEARAKAEREREELYVRLQETNAELQAANRAKDDFLALVSHELRSPMTAIVGWSQLLHMRYGEDPELAQPIGMIQRSARLQAQLIDDLLDAARMMSGKLMLQMTTVDLADVVRTAVRLHVPVADGQGVVLTTSIEESVPFYGDPTRLEQVIANLLSNATKFTPSGGRVHIILQHVDHHITLSVDDTGIGIDPGFLPEIFDRLTQQQSGFKAGLGLGLSIVKHLVEEHGGTITASSPGVGRGARFEITFPAGERT